MEKNSSSEKETHDFMNVDSFSQLPFIRPAPVREKPIRLFGIEFGTPSSSSSNKHDDPSSESDSAAPDANVRDDAKDATTEDSGRKFECHYCCRNFPTSQALGGHQNAHKRERQHAKRAHLQSALAHNSIGSDGAAHHHVYGYGLANYHHRLGSVPTMSTSSHGSARLPSPYPSSWSSRLYGGHASISHHQQQPINGSPLPGLWRIPAVQTGSPHVVGFNHHHQHRDRPSSVLPLPLLSAGEEGRPASMGGPSQSRHVYDAGTGNVHDHVSLDLHL